MGIDVQLQRLRDAVLMVTGDAPLYSVLEHIVEAACDLFDARYAALGVIGDDGLLSDFIYAGVDEDTAERIGHLPRGRGLLGTLISDPEPLRLDDLSAHPDSVGFPDHHPTMQSFLGAPIRVRDTIYGNLYLSERRDGRPFTPDDQGMLLALAVVAGSAIGSARAQDRRANIAVIQERERIGRDLHDTTMQRLFAIGLEVQLVAGRLPKEQYALAATLEKTVKDLDETIREIRTTIFSLQADSASDSVTVEQLEQLLREVAAEANRPLGFGVDFISTLSYDGTISEALVGHLSSAAREGLTNVARHARATECRVTLNVDSDVTVTVDDNGVGVVPNSAAIGYGLRNLHKRAETLGGTAQLDSGPDGGTRLTWCVPVVP